MIDISVQSLDVLPPYVREMYIDVTTVLGREFRTKQFYELFIAEGNILITQHRNEKELQNTLGAIVNQTLTDSQYLRLLTDVYIATQELTKGI